MKKFKKMIALLAAAVMTVAPGATTLKAEAATPTTYYLKFDVEDNMWRMQINEWVDEAGGRELYYLNEGDEKVKDGDVVVILSNEENEGVKALVNVLKSEAIKHG